MKNRGGTVGLQACVAINSGCLDGCIVDHWNPMHDLWVTEHITSVNESASIDNPTKSKFEVLEHDCWAGLRSPEVLF